MQSVKAPSEFDVSMFVVTMDNQYIDVGEYDMRYDSPGMFVCLTNDFLNRDYCFNNSICIYKDWKKSLNATMEEFKRHVDNPPSVYNSGCVHCK